MWPLEPSVLNGLPAELQPSAEELEDLEHPWELLVLLRDILAKRVTETRISENAAISRPELTVIDGPVWVAEGATLKPFSSVEGPAYIGRGALIGAYSLVRQSILMDGSIVGARSEVGRSILGRGSAAPHNNAVLDSMFDADVNFAGESITANERLDHATIRTVQNGERIDTGMPKLGAIIGRGTRTGGRVMTMPGVMIGKDALVPPATTIKKNIADNNPDQ
jgi:UDP-N-acetylglucosamine diphosphorylase / glucose-1-phosphate thymidylyltransferase / UDP-N-acetylgalactosamine diphosphorylase / glucosamine-1-phosphate N-acetyltransferase / galactosamine-1-phosphate N-acetyltransferase